MTLSRRPRRDFSEWVAAFEVGPLRTPNYTGRLWWNTRTRRAEYASRKRDILWDSLDGEYGYDFIEQGRTVTPRTVLAGLLYNLDRPMQHLARHWLRPRTVT